MQELKVTGQQNFMGHDIPVVAGGFGKDAKCVSDKTIAEIHEVPVTEIRKSIGRNASRFRENVDFIDLKNVGNEITNILGYTQMQISKAEHIYILSERGYAKLIKIMDTDLAWEIHDKLIDEYFQLREEKRHGIPEKEKLPSVNMMIKNIKDVLHDAGVEPKYIAAEVARLYSDAGYPVKVPLISDVPVLWDCTTIAKELGINSTSGRPHDKAVSAIIQKIPVSEAEIVQTAYSRNGHDGVTVQYQDSVLQKVRQWLEDNGYPTMIEYQLSNGNINKCKVVY